MPTTERLYYADSRLLEFDASVVGLRAGDDGRIAVTLDRTAFYPTGGGQPNDTGTLGDARVIDCIDAEDSGVLHFIQGPIPEIGDKIHGKVDWLRRLDYMQQHTGQHILSAAFVNQFDAPTRSFRVLEDECEIDVALDDPTDERIEEAVDLANQIVWEDRPIRIRHVTSAEAAALPLRKEPARDGGLRVIEIDDFDLTPCGGTHAKSTGEVGVIAVRSSERAKGLTRIHFMAGIRALADYRKANRTAHDVAALFSAGREDSPALVAHLIEEKKKLARRVRELEEIASGVEAEQLLSDVRLVAGSRPPDLESASDSERVSDARVSSPTVREGSRLAAGYRPPDLESASDSERVSSPRYRTGRGSDRVSESTPSERVGSPTVREGPVNNAGTRVVARIFPDRSADSLKHLALALIAHPNVVALLGSRDGTTARLVFARSADAPGDMDTLIHGVCPIIGGRGGGRPDMAQGGGKNVEKLGEALDQAAKSLIWIRRLHRFHRFRS